jgi:tetratricopeptide (TPR) repeat protein
MTALAILYQEEGKLDEADPLLSKALEMDRRVLGEGHLTTGYCLTSLARLRLAQKRYADAEALLEEALNTPGTEGPYVWLPSERRSLLGSALMAQSRFTEAEPLLTAGYEGLFQRKSVIPQRDHLQQAGRRVLQLYTDWGKPAQAAEWRRKIQAAGAESHD